MLRPSHERIKPVNDFNQEESVAWQSDGEDGLVEVTELPPGVGRVLILDLCNKAETLLAVEDECVSLTPALTAPVNELEPWTEPKLERGLSEAMELEKLFDFSLISDPDCIASGRSSSFNKRWFAR